MTQMLFTLFYIKSFSIRAAHARLGLDQDGTKTERPTFERKAVLKIELPHRKVNLDVDKN
jgi:hypothetical protein